MAWLLLLALTALFVGLHLLPFAPDTRNRVADTVGGANAFKALFTILSLIGLFGAFFAAARAPVVPLWTASPAALWAALVLTALGFVLLGAAYGPGDGGRLARHPMLAGIAAWSLAHVLANGELAYLVLFGALVLYSVVAMPLSDRRLAREDPQAFARARATTSLVPFIRFGGGTWPWQGALAGLAAWALFLVLHPWLFGVSPLPG